jgi:hypothetical protein
MQTITYADYLDADNNMVGQCAACHARQGNCEPDASNYRCECCGALQVYGMEELAMMGEIEVTDTPPVVPMGDDNAYPVDDRKLKPFCGETKRFDLSTPFWHEGRVWATDGHVAVRYAEKSPPPGTGQPTHVPRMVEMPWKEDTQCNHPWPTTKELRGKERETVFIAHREIAIRYARKVARLGSVYFCPSGGPRRCHSFRHKQARGRPDALGQAITQLPPHWHFARGAFLAPPRTMKALTFGAEGNSTLTANCSEYLATPKI